MLRFAILLLLTQCTLVQAGSSDAIITGKTESGRTHLEVHVGDLSGLIRLVKITIDGESSEFKPGPGSNQTVIRDEENGVYVLILRDGDRHFRLWMVPGSEKILEQKRAVYRSRFAAVLEATDPRKSKKGLTPRITIGCTLAYDAR